MRQKFVMHFLGARFDKPFNNHCVIFPPHKDLFLFLLEIMYLSVPFLFTINVLSLEFIAFQLHYLYGYYKTVCYVKWILC